MEKHEYTTAGFPLPSTNPLPVGMCRLARRDARGGSARVVRLACFSFGWNRYEMEPDLSGFPPEAVIGPALTPGARSAARSVSSARFTGLLRLTAGREDQPYPSHAV